MPKLTILLLLLFNFGPPFYSGYVGGGVLAPLGWSAGMAIFAVIVLGLLIFGSLVLLWFRNRYNAQAKDPTKANPMEAPNIRDEIAAEPEPTSHPQTEKYYSLIARAVASLPNNTVEARQALYDRARAWLAKQLKEWGPAEAHSEISALEAAIRRVEGHASSSASSISATNVSPEVEAVFQKLHRLMDDERAQNNGLAEPFRSKVLGGADCDEIVGATGSFGRNPRNPIPVNGPLGEVIYLSKLVTHSSQRIMFHRLGSTGKVDAYETVSLDGELWDVLFFDPYHPHKSRLAPTLYQISEEWERLLFGADEFVASFPDRLPDAISNTTDRLLGLRMRPLQVREALDRMEFERPARHKVWVAEVERFIKLIGPESDK